MWMALVASVVVAQAGAARRFDERELERLSVRRWLVRADGEAVMSFSCWRREGGAWCQAFSFRLRRPEREDPLAEVRAASPAERKKWLARTRADACKVKETERQPMERELCACADDACVWARVVAEVEALNSVCQLDEPTQYAFQLSGAPAAQLLSEDEDTDPCGWRKQRRLAFDEKGKLVLEFTSARDGGKEDAGCARPPQPAVQWVERRDISFPCQGLRLR